MYRTADVTENEIRNKVLLSLRPEAQEFVGARLSTRRIFAGEVIYEDHAMLTHVVFPHEGVISYMARMDDGRAVEKTSVGLEGYVGFTLVMGTNHALSQSVVQVPGYASWLSRQDMEEAIARFQCLRDAMLHYASFLIAQLMETVACNSLHTAEQRVIRWLLQAFDRVTADHFSVTQKTVADVLGLRRATVSEVCSRLQAGGLIDYSRGVVRIREHHGLMARTCECVGRMRLRKLE
jgi:CRP-like cAMP-binding protein